MSNIEWTDETLNDLAGCKAVSPGCANCYAAKMAKRLAAMAEAKIAAGQDPGALRKYIGTVDAHGRWTGKINYDAEGTTLLEPLKRTKPTMYFVNSMSDLYHKDVPVEYILKTFDMMRRAHWHTFQVLTKRSERLEEVSKAVGDWPANVWQGVSVESGEYVYRVDDLRRCGARVKFLSCEPLLGPLSGLDLTGIDQVICGGESGPGARPMHSAWVRSLRDLCVAAKAAFFFKQNGEYLHEEFIDESIRRTLLARFERHRGDQPDCSVRFYRRGEWAAPGVVWTGREVEVFYRVGKKAAGRLLDGRTWDEMPRAHQDRAAV